MKAQAVTTSKWEREEADDLVKARKALMGAMASKWEDAVICQLLQRTDEHGRTDSPGNN